MNRFLLFFVFAVFSSQAYALTATEAASMAVGEGDARVEALRASVAKADAKTMEFIQAMGDDEVKIVAGKPVIVRDGKAFDPVSGAPTNLTDTAEDILNNNRMRGEIESALAALQLLSPDEKLRRAAVKTLQGNVDEAKLPLIDKALAQEAVA
ncbi:MAG: urea ABC transporter permease subunit UrtB, partial [Rhodoferax sp.]|nr:urea ABC transporter permease subunit UrtB [Rhodoferax sp.]